MGEVRCTHTTFTPSLCVLPGGGKKFHLNIYTVSLKFLFSSCTQYLSRMYHKNAIFFLSVSLFWHLAYALHFPVSFFNFTSRIISKRAHLNPFSSSKFTTSFGCHLPLLYHNSRIYIFFYALVYPDPRTANGSGVIPLNILRNCAPVLINCLAKLSIFDDSHFPSCCWVPATIPTQHTFLFTLFFREGDNLKYNNTTSICDSILSLLYFLVYWYIRTRITERRMW